MCIYCQHSAKPIVKFSVNMRTKQESKHRFIFLHIKNNEFNITLFHQNWIIGYSSGANGTVTDSGLSNRQVFESYLNNHFLKYVQGRDKDEPILLHYEGHRSHISLTLVNWAKENNVVLFVLPAHTSHALQPLDIGCFGPFKKIYNAEYHKFIRDNSLSKVTEYNVYSLAC